MKTLTIPVPDFNHTLPRVVVLCTVIAGLGAATWYGTRPPPVDNGESFVERPNVTPPDAYRSQPIAYRDRTEAGDSECSPWDISPVAMEAILQEMLRRGWKPPTQGEAIASLEQPGGPQVISLDPNAPMPVTPRGQPPVTTDQPDESSVADESTAPNPTQPNPAAPVTKPPVAAPARPAPPAAQPPSATKPPAVQPAAPKPVTPPAANAPAIPPSAPPATAPAEPDEDPT